MKILLEYRDLAEYIIRNYKDKIIEVGIGNMPQVAVLLNDYFDITVTDITQKDYNGLKFYKDDLFSPNMEIYKNASLIYSIRPPIEIQSEIAKISKKVGCDLIIRPFGNENTDLKRYFKNKKLINYKNSRFYLYQKDLIVKE